MNKPLLLVLFFSVFAVTGQEVISPLMTNPALVNADLKTKAAANNLDSTFVYIMDTLDLPVWDDFSVNKFEHYDANYTDGNVTSQWYYHLMDATNTVPQDPSFIFCDSTHARHDTVSVTVGIPTTSTDYFTTGMPVWVNDLNSYPIGGQLVTLYQECYVLIDSVIDGVPDPTQDTIWYNGGLNQAPDFVQDSAHIFTVDVNDPNKIWTDNKAYHNYTFAVNPWSLGVATLDGVDSTGMPYNFGGGAVSATADYLTSKHINLFGKTDVYLTFLYQAEGYGNMPEENDSLIVDFWLPDSSQWYTWWYAKGELYTTPDVWDTAHIPIPSVFLDNGFRFRFRNHATISGGLDHWHIDYVNLKDNDLPAVSNFSDLAIAYPINSLLKDYTHVPWDHYKNASASSKLLDTVNLYVYNSDLTPTNFANGQFEARYGGVLQAGTPYVLPNPAISGTWTGNWETGLNQYRFPVSSAYTYDQGVITAPHPQATFDVKVNIDAAVSGSNIYDVNDTTYFQQFFSNYYAYDDGSAEAAYGLSYSNAPLAYKFETYEADTLTGVLIAFIPSVNDMSNAEFLITIWDDNNGEPGNIIYQDDYFNTNSPVYGGGNNAFHYYTFMNDQYIVVDDIFYIGYEQLEDQPLNVGLDRNIDNSDKIFFLNVSGNWINTAETASLMIRPVFSTALNYTLTKEEIRYEEKTIIKLFPNPTNGTFSISGIELDDYSVAVYDMSGRGILTTFNDNRLDIGEFEAGIYLVQVKNELGESIFLEKLIKE